MRGLGPEDEKSVIVEVEAPLRTDHGAGGKARIIRFFGLGVIDLSGLHYDQTTRHLFVVSDGSNTIYEIDLHGRIYRARAFPGCDQEGLAFDDEGYLYIAQDSGGIIKIKPLW